MIRQFTANFEEIWGVSAKTWPPKPEFNNPRAEKRWEAAPAAAIRISFPDARPDGPSRNNSVLHWQTDPASVVRVPLSENLPPAPIEGAPKNHEKNANSWG